MNHENSLLTKVSLSTVFFFLLVFPGVPDNVSIEPVMLRKELIPGQIIKDLKLEVCMLLFLLPNAFRKYGYFILFFFFLFSLRYLMHIIIMSKNMRLSH